MSKEAGAAERLPEIIEPEISGPQVAAYLASHPDFFLTHQTLLADLTLPHESGKAISLLERQISILRDYYRDSRLQLGVLLENARENDQLFEITRALVLTLLRAETAAEVISAVRDTLLHQHHIDACELIFSENSVAASGSSIRSDEALTSRFADVFRLEHTHCGAPDPAQLEYLFAEEAVNIRSTAICPIQGSGDLLGILAIGSKQNNYFNINLDTLFLDFIGTVVGVVLSKQISR
jgi:uncharacterized protein YigA (DUF484 family)